MSVDEGELRRAWQRWVGEGATADAWFDTLVGMHRAPGRHYHDVRHVRWVVHHVGELAAATDPPLPAPTLREVVGAAFFHDAVYDVARTDNEAASARLAVRALRELGWDVEALGRVAAMIEATAHGDDPESGTTTPDDPATAVLLAADLGVLATEPGRYGDYVRAVRREYGHLDDAAWRAGRTAFVRSMLDRERIFPGALGLEHWERRARANLTAELAGLG